MTLTHRSWGGDLELRGGDGRTIVGIAAPFNAPTNITDHRGSYQEVIRPGAFARTIVERGPNRVKILAQHDARSLPLGRATALREDAAGLYLEARISKTAAGDEALELIKDGALDGLSIGFDVPKDGERWSGNLRELLGVRLFECSVVTFGAYPSALITGVRSAPETIAYDPNFDPDFLRRRLSLRPTPNDWSN
jgi:HK97 family phage prohead protease